MLSGEGPLRLRGQRVRFERIRRALGMRGAQPSERADATGPAQGQTVPSQAGNERHQRVYVSPAALNFHVVGGDSYTRAHARIIETCDEVTGLFTNPYASLRRDTLHHLAEELDQLRRRKAVPATDRHRVDAWAALLRLLQLCAPPGHAAATIPERSHPTALTHLADLLTHAEDDPSQYPAVLLGLWAALRHQLPLPPDLRTRAETLLPAVDRIAIHHDEDDDEDGHEQALQTLVFIRAALEVDRLWDACLAGAAVPAREARTLLRAFDGMDEGGGYFGHRLHYLYLQAELLDDRARDALSGDDLVEGCMKLRNAIGHPDPLAVEVQILAATVENGWPLAWKPTPAWVTTHPTTGFQEFLRTRDPLIALRYLLIQAERSMHRPTGHRFKEADQLVRTLQRDPQVNRFPPAGRHYLLFGLSVIGHAQQLNEYNDLFRLRGAGEFRLSFHDFVISPLARIAGFRLLRSRTYAEYSDGSSAVMSLHPRLVLPEGATALPGLTADMALTAGRLLREDLTFMTDYMDLTMPGGMVEQKVGLSLVCLEYAIDQLRATGGRALRFAASELLATLKMARDYAMPIDTDGYLDIVDPLLPWRARGGAQYAHTFGHIASGDSHFLREQSERLTTYWQVGLADIRDRKEFMHDVTVISALTNTAVSLNLHARFGGLSPKDAKGQIRYALTLLHEAIALHRVSEMDIDPRAVMRMYACTAWLTYVDEMFTLTGDLHDAGYRMDEALTDDVVMYQELAYDHLPADPDARRDALNAIIDLTVAVDAERWPTAAEHFEEILLGVITNPDADIGRAIEAVTRLTSAYQKAGLVDQVAQPVLSLLPRLDELARLPLPESALSELQGVISDAAVAECLRGRTSSAVNIVESGTGRVLANLSPKGSSLDRRVQSPAAFAAVSGRPVLYLVAGTTSGAAIAIRPDEGVAQLVVPELTKSWNDLFEAGRADQGEAGIVDEVEALAMRSVVLRSGADAEAPGPDQVYDVLDQMGELLSTVYRGFGLAAGTAVDLVPVGGLSRLPWQAAFLEAGLGLCATQSSVGSLGLASAQVAPRGQIARGLAVTCPRPSSYGGKELPLLEAGEAEGELLGARYGAQHLTGVAATRSNVVSGLRTFRRFAHFAVHGTVLPHSWDSSYLILAPEQSNAPPKAESDALAEESLDALAPAHGAAAGARRQVVDLDEERDPHLPLSQLINLGVRTDVAFLAACWSAAPNRALPEESISYQSATLRAGARCVIAPLWPVEDTVTKDFVTTFYDQWLTHGLTVMEAFTVAVERCRDDHPYSTTWAAFTIHGAAFDTQ
jgi:hypothetical protein